ncbi:MAG TPA: hypothetical protein VHS56_03160 [Candidatus Cybelea sp.]|nr:hypothetical protein [Candidatus Cybelea sp.]
MRLSGICRYVCAAFVAAVSIVGCGAGPSSGPAMPAAAASAERSNFAHFAYAGSWLRHDSSSGGDLVYMAEDENIGIYSFAGKEVGELKGFEFSYSSGLCSDMQGNVWAAYEDSLLEYQRGGTIPIAQLYTPGNPTSCAVDPATGDIAVTEQSNASGSNVAVFSGIYATPAIYADADIFYYEFSTFDSQGDLFVNGVGLKKNHSVLAELLKGGSTLGTVTTDEKFEKVGGLQWDGQDLADGDSERHVIYEMSVASGHATTVGTIKLGGWIDPRFKVIEPFAIGNGQIVLTISDRQTGFYKYPAGGKSIRRLPITTGAKTISLAPSGLRKESK